MKEKRAEGLLAIWADIDEDYRRTFREWHNCEHMIERVTIPGFYVGRRHEGVDRPGYYLMFYETSDSKVLGSEPYLRSLNNPTPWTRDSLTHFKNTVRAIYALKASAGRRPPVDAPYLSVFRFNVESGSEREVLQWYSKEHLTEICSIQGVYRGRLYEVDSNISGIKTEERKIHGASPDQRRYLTLFEMYTLDILTDKAWQEAMDGEMVKRLRDIHQEWFWIDCALYAPEMTLIR